MWSRSRFKKNWKIFMKLWSYVMYWCKILNLFYFIRFTSKSFSRFICQTDLNRIHPKSFDRFKSLINLVFFSKHHYFIIIYLYLVFVLVKLFFSGSLSVLFWLKPSPQSPEGMRHKKSVTLSVFLGELNHF